MSKYFKHIFKEHTVLSILRVFFDIDTFDRTRLHQDSLPINIQYKEFLKSSYKGVKQLHTRTE